MEGRALSTNLAQSTAGISQTGCGWWREGNEVSGEARSHGALLFLAVPLLRKDISSLQTSSSPF